MGRFLVETSYERFETVTTTCHGVTLVRVRCVKGCLFPREARLLKSMVCLRNADVTLIQRCANVTLYININI
jgi:hypothetical protein